MLSFQTHSFLTPQKSVLNLQDINAGSSVQVVVPLSVASSATQQTTALFYNLNYQEGDTFITKTFQNFASISIATRGVIDILNVSYSRDVISRGNNVGMSIEFQ